MGFYESTVISQEQVPTKIIKSKRTNSLPIHTHTHTKICIFKEDGYKKCLNS